MCSDNHVICSGDVLQMCVSGQLEIDKLCTWGCSMVGTPHCRQLLPSGSGVTLNDLDDDASLQSITIGNATVNSDDGSITAVRSPGSGVISGIGYNTNNNVAVFRFANLTINGTVTLVGSKSIALVGSVRST